MTRRLIVIGVVLLALLLAGDIGARMASQYAVSRDLQKALALERPPRVTLGGFPFLPNLVSGRVPSVSVSTGSTTLEGVQFDRIEVDLEGVGFSAATLLSGADGDIRVDHGRGTATLTEASIPSQIFGQPVTFMVRFEGGDTEVSSDRFGGTFNVIPAIKEGKLVLRPTSRALPVSVKFDLPEIVPGILYTDVTVAGSRATLAFELTDARLPCCG